MPIYVEITQLTKIGNEGRKEMGDKYTTYLRYYKGTLLARSQKNPSRLKKIK